ncbi:MAG: NHL repeat-containing protein [Ignavibacteria bacterium]|nr:NHL repeat-containing protein [Ignavibacteria bacterium]
MIILLIINIFSFLLSLPEEGTLVKQFEVKGFESAVSVSQDNLGKIYVLDNKANQVIKLDENLSEVKRNGKQGWGDGLFDSPTNVDASTGLDIFICDPKNNRVQRFDRNLNYISSLLTNLSTFPPQYQFNTPVSSVVMNSSDLYVLDKDNNRVVIFQQGLNPVNSFGEFQNSEGRIIKAKKMLKDKNNFIFILDAGQNAVLKFDSFGSFVKKIQIDSIYSISIYDNSLYLFTKEKIYAYNAAKNTFEYAYDLFDSHSITEFTDFVVLNKEKYLILEKNKLSYWKLTNKN